MASLLADEAARLALVDRDLETARETQSVCRAKGAEAEAYYCDIGAKTDIEDMLARVSEDLGPVDALINNAGTVVGRYVHQYEYDELARTMSVNFVGGAYLTDWSCNDMMERGQGHIVNMASVIGLVAMPRMVNMWRRSSPSSALPRPCGWSSSAADTRHQDALRLHHRRRHRPVPWLQGPASHSPPEAGGRGTEGGRCHAKGQDAPRTPLVARIIPMLKLLPTPPTRRYPRRRRLLRQHGRVRRSATAVKLAG
jgi:NAD(P)-dependent dehydrogenase (short-subunit alcohol dehydrogenase family)